MGFYAVATVFLVVYVNCYVVAKVFWVVSVIFSFKIWLESLLHHKTKSFFGFAFFIVHQAKKRIHVIALSTKSHDLGRYKKTHTEIPEKKPRQILKIL